MAEGHWPEADSKFKEAIAIYEALKQPFETAKACYCYGTALKEIGRDEGEDFLQKARGIFEHLGAKGWLAKVKTHEK